jgi:TetR/AcrR family transcriptional repressor of nem operon
VLRAAGRALRTRGLEGLSVGRVMAAAGMTVGGFYHHFRNKQQLVVAALRQAAEDAREALTADLDGLEPSAWLGQVSRRYLGRDHRDGTVPICALPGTVSEVAHAGATERRAYAEVCAEIVDDLEPAVRGAAQDHEFGTPRQRAVALLVTWIGAMAVARATRGSALSDEILDVAARLADSVALPRGSRR